VSFPVVFRPQAEAEFEEAQAWYEERLRGLGQEFVTSVQATINLVSRNPGQFQRIDGEVRRALVRRFPYAILYLADLESVTIIAVFHTSRDPAAWRDRER
jgi:plasmid stabilization system protein ParE